MIEWLPIAKVLVVNVAVSTPLTTLSVPVPKVVPPSLKVTLPLGVPVVSGLPFGHVRENATLPMGLQATLDGVNGDLIINEAAVV